jgi:hypothetical protein
MIPLTPALLVGAANAFIGFGEDSTCRGTMVDRLTRQVRADPGAPWDAALVHHAGYWSHYDHRGDVSSWPIPPARSAHAIAAFARSTNILDPRPEVGDLFVLWSPSRRRFVHTGIVLQVGQRGEFHNGQAFVECSVLSPNVHPDGRFGGPSTLRLTRRISPAHGDWFIRWTELTDGAQNESPVTQPQSPKTDAAREAA